MYPRSDITQFYASCKNVGRGVNLGENKVKCEENGQGWYIINNMNHYWLESEQVELQHMRKQLIIKNSRKPKKNKEKMNGLQKECIDNLLEMWRAMIRATPGDRWEKVIWKDASRLWCVVLRNSLHEWTISSTILTKLVSQTFVGCVVQEMGLYLI